MESATFFINLRESEMLRFLEIETFWRLPLSLANDGVPGGEAACPSPHRLPQPRTVTGDGEWHLRTAGLAATVVLFTSGHNHMDTGDLTNELLQVLSALKAGGIRKSQNDA